MLVQPGETWLDIGAGAGRYALPLARALAPSAAGASPPSTRRGACSTPCARPPPSTPSPTSASSRVAGRTSRPRPVRPTSASSPTSRTTSRPSARSSAAMEAAARRVCVAVLMERQPSSIADVCWPSTWGEERVSLPALPEFVELLRAHGRRPLVRMLERAPRRFASRDELVGFLRRQLWVADGPRRTARFLARARPAHRGRCRRRRRARRPAAVAHRHRDLARRGDRGGHQPGRRQAVGPALGPRGVARLAHRQPRDLERRAPRHLAARRPVSRRVDYARRGRGGAVRRLGRFEGRQARRRPDRPCGSRARRPRSGWSRPNKERVERLIAAGQMLPGRAGRHRGGQAARHVDAPRRRRGPRRPGRPRRRLRREPAGPGQLGRVQPQRPARPARVDRPGQAARRRERSGSTETATKAARNERANEWVPPDQRTPRTEPALVRGFPVRRRSGRSRDPSARSSALAAAHPRDRGRLEQQLGAELVVDTVAGVEGQPADLLGDARRPAGAPRGSRIAQPCSNPRWTWIGSGQTRRSTAAAPAVTAGRSR